MIRFLKWLWWALFKNDEDGYYGDDVWRAGREKTFWLAVQWWWRNKFHNLFCHVIDRPRAIMTVRKAWNVHEGWRRNFKRMPSLWQSYRGKENFPQYMRARNSLFISFRTEKWEGYFGWRPPLGWFGASFRRRKND